MMFFSGRMYPHNDIGEPMGRGGLMNREKSASCVLLRLIVLTAGVGLSGCQEWMAEPVRVEQHYGESVRIAMANQLYDPNRALHPATEAP